MNLIPLLVYRPGTSVGLGEKLTGTVVGVWVQSNNHVLYKVVWWNGNERKEDWIESFLLSDEPSEHNAIAIGYKR
jgi:hypothetical protein